MIKNKRVYLYGVNIQSKPYIKNHYYSKPIKLALTQSNIQKK